MAEGKTSPWVWVGCGCGVAILLLALAVGLGGFFAAKEIKELADDMADPAARADKVRSILGMDEMPPDLYPMLGMSIPFVLDVALLSDMPPEDDGEPQGFGDAGLVYIHLKLGSNLGELREFFDGSRDDVRVLRDNGIQIDVDEILGRGTLEREDATVRWITQRGDVNAMGNASGDALSAMMLIECKGDSKPRIAIWFETEIEAEAGELAGTPADPQELERFANYLRPCPAA